MKCIIASFLLLFSLFASAQNLTGIWRGYFTQGIGFYKEQYKYELQLDQQKNNALKGVTYSYKSIVFYGKARLKGIFMDKTQNLVLKEDTLMEVKMTEKTEPCLMTCYLDYYKDDNSEVLDGNFTSVNIATKKDCGAGMVHLVRVQESDFKKEDFLVKKPGKPIQSVPTLPKKNNQLPASGNAATPQIKDTVAIKNNKPLENEKPITSIPRILQERENNLVRSIITNSPDIKIELYDNGEIDDDTITVYHNNEVVAFKRRLSKDPITINIKASENEALHEFILVADNLGRIPPNTALMVLTTGGKRYELFLSSNEKKNAKVIIEFKIPSKPTR